ncbi:MAG: cytochrome-c peroxidase [Chitinophagales bacterium]|nr:cytochrome-c peroxidase [Chitinophagales bacterium]
MKRLVRLFLLGIILLSSCAKEEDINEVYPLVYPPHFPEPVYKFEDNPFTLEGFALGRKLFFDPILSINNTISCGSCHAPVHYFADHNVALSTGVYGRTGIRNAPVAFNLMWNEAFMWDGGVNHIELSGFPAMTDTNEMAETMNGILFKLQNSPEYPALFEKAFGEGPITDQHLFYALTQFSASVVSATSKYDYYIQGKLDFSEVELAGLELFRAKCEACHQEPLFTDYSFRNNGLDLVFTDLGRARITQNQEDLGKFKVPTLRNVLHTYPYMHDGRFRNIDEVLDHYSSGIQNSASLDPLLSQGISLSEQDKANLKAFLRTLTDVEFLENRLYYEP